jgi:type VI secretion system protein ImpF
MATRDYEGGVVLSLLDRLIDLEPGSGQEARANSWEELRQHKESLCRDLTALLNTRRAEADFPPDYEEADRSLLTFGITDFTAYDLKHHISQERVRRSIEQAIRRFEPRLARVAVAVKEPDPLKPVLQFQISAVLRGDAADEPVTFDATLQRESRRVAVSGGDS